MLVKVSYDNSHVSYFQESEVEEIVEKCRRLWSAVPAEAIRAIIPAIADGMSCNFMNLRLEGVDGMKVFVRLCTPSMSSPEVLEGVLEENTLYVEGTKVPVPDYAKYGMDEGPVAICPRASDSSDTTFVVWKA